LCGVPAGSCSRSARASRVFSKPVSTTGRTALSAPSTRAMAASSSSSPDGVNTSGQSCAACIQPLRLLSGSLSHTTPSKSSANTVRAEETSSSAAAEATSAPREETALMLSLPPLLLLLLNDAKVERCDARRGAHNIFLSFSNDSSLSAHS
jgi:hypothetical protein